MKLYGTETSPYVRIVRIVLTAKGLGDEVEFVLARTREAGSPYYAINPSGRVPFLVSDDGIGMEDSGLIVDWLEQFEPSVLPAGPDRWEHGRLEARARSMLDGLAVLVREFRRPENERSPTIVAHELARADRMLEWWEGEIGAALMSGPLNLAQITLAVTLQSLSRLPGFDWQEKCPTLAGWLGDRQMHPAIGVG